MARIKEINFSSVGRMMGCTCDKCGQYIQNIWTVTFTDGVRMNYGIDCFRKLCATGNLSDYGKKLMNKALKSLKHWQEKLEAEKLLTEETDVGYQRTQEHVDWKSDDYWCGKPWAEYHEWMLTQWYPQRFKEEQEVIDRFSGISFRREDGEILNWSDFQWYIGKEMIDLMNHMPKSFERTVLESGRQVFTQRKTGKKLEVIHDCFGIITEINRV